VANGLPGGEYIAAYRPPSGRRNDDHLVGLAGHLSNADFLTFLDVTERCIPHVE